MRCNCRGGPNCCMLRQPSGHLVWPKPEYISTSPMGIKSHIYRAPYWVSDRPAGVYR